MDGKENDMRLFQDLESVPRGKVLQEVKIWTKQLFLLCLLGIFVAIVQWSETVLWITILSLVVLHAVLLLLAILRAIKFLEEETNEHENQDANRPGAH